MATPQVYRSIFTGQEIDTILAAVKNKLDASLIVNDYSGGTGKLASAEIAKDLDGRINAFSDPNYIKTLILSVPDSNIYTTEEKTKLATMSGQFLGSYPDGATRDSKVRTSSLLGGELTFIENDGTGLGLGGWFKWNNQTNQWEKAPLFDNAEDVFTSVPVAASTIIASFDSTKFSSMRGIVQGKNATNSYVNIQEFLMIYDGTNTYISVFGEAGNYHNLFGLSTRIDAGIVSLVAATTVNNTTIRVRRLAVM